MIWMQSRFVDLDLLCYGQEQMEMDSTIELTRSRKTRLAKAGVMLSSTRRMCKLRHQDVQKATRRIARFLGPEFSVTTRMLALIESGRTIPSVYGLSSLCAVYHLEMPQVLKWYGVRGSLQVSGPPLLSVAAAA
jgi:hypothetical protein